MPNIQCLYCQHRMVAINKDMKLNIDNRDTNTVVIEDKVISYAKGDEVVKLIAHGITNITNVIAKLLSNNIQLNPTEEHLYINICKDIHNTNTCNINNLINNLSAIGSRHLNSYRRAYTNLIAKGVISNNQDGTTVTVNPDYNIDVKYKTVKYIVIEVVNVTYGWELAGYDCCEFAGDYQNKLLRAILQALYYNLKKTTTNSK